ncbi:MAG: hypothetical protein PSV35_02500 [bacterium]|nr:hypothetical protein [bacterium]
MNCFILNPLLLRSLFLTLSLFVGSTCYADRFGGGGFHDDGVHDNNWNDSSHVDDGYNNVGNYHPGNGWIAPVIIDNDDGNFSTNCQTTQQCDSFGNCTTNQDCN